MGKVKEMKWYQKWIFQYDNPQRNLPFINKRRYTILVRLINTFNNVEERIEALRGFKFKVERCYVPTYNGLGMPTYLPRKNELRIIVGRPQNHFCREVYAVIINV